MPIALPVPSATHAHCEAIIARLERQLVDTKARLAELEERMEQIDEQARLLAA